VGVLLLIILLVLLLGGFGTYPRRRYSSRWGYGASRILGLLLVILIVMALIGHSRI
jgi:hypothetical protein